MLGVGGFDPYGDDTPNPLLVQAQVDTDPYSPTYGQPIYRKLSPKATGPDYETTQKGNPGQPGPNVPTTAQGNVSATFEMVPPPGTPAKAAPKTASAAKESAAAAVPDYLGDAVPQAQPTGAPVAPAAKAPEGDTPDYLGDAAPQATPSGAPVAPAYTGQYLSAGTSPGAQATGTPIAEGRVPGAAFQAAINTAEDPKQKAAIAASQLGIPLDRIIVSGSGRLAAVDEKGQPYYIEPAPVSSYYTPQTKGESGRWEPAPLHINPYQTPFAPVTPQSETGNTVGNWGRTVAALVPTILANAPAFVGGAIGSYFGPAGTAVGTGAGTYAGSTVRQGVANLLTSNQADKRPVFTAQRGEDALFNALIGGGVDYFLRRFIPPLSGTTEQLGRPWFGIPGFRSPEIPITRQQPYGLQDKLLPWEAPQRWELPPNPQPQLTPAGNPPGAPPAGARIQPPPISETPSTSVPIPAEHPAAPSSPGGVSLNPLGESAEPRGPYAPTSPEEARANSLAFDTLPKQRTPLVTQAQIERRADEIFRHMAANGNTQADLRELVPGSDATMGGRTGNAGLNALERWMRNEPEFKNFFDYADQQQANARINFARRLIGSQDDLEHLEAQRAQDTAALRRQAFSNATPTDPTAAIDEIDRVLAGPEGKREGVAGPLRRLRASFFDADGNIETNPEMLYGVRKNITDALSPMARGTERDASTASALLQNVIGRLDAAIEAGAPGFRAYMDRFSELSRPIDAMDYLLRRNMTDATTGAPTLAKVDQTIKDIERRRLMPGMNDAKSVSDEQFQALQNLRDDLRRSANLGKGKALGSNTAENFAGGSYLNYLTGPTAHLIGRGVGGFLGSWPGYLAAQGSEAALSRINSAAAIRLKQALLARVLNYNGAGQRALGGPALPPPTITP